MQKNIDAMAFYHDDGFVPAWKQATQFAGKEGRIGTLPDVMNARLSTEPGSLPWETYFTTMTAEYMGYTPGKNPILIVAHGIGPMATLEGVLAAYKHEYGDKNHEQRGGRISQAEFRKLESGAYGPVEVVDLGGVLRRYQYPFIERITFQQAIREPLLKARLGSRWEEYIQKHTQLAINWHKEQLGITPENKYNLPNYENFLHAREKRHQEAINSSDPYILQLADANECYYNFWEKLGLSKFGIATAHLISIGGLTHMQHEGVRESLICDVGCHGWSDGTRLLSIKANDPVTNIHPGPQSHMLLQEHWQKLMCSVKESMSFGLSALTNIGDKLFTQYHKKGEGMDTYEPEFEVTSAELVGQPVEFITTIGGYHGFFKYGINEVRALTPPTANAYKLVSEPEIIWTDGNPTHHKVLIQFYKVEADTSQRLMREKELHNNYDLMMKLIEAE